MWARSWVKISWIESEPLSRIALKSRGGRGLPVCLGLRFWLNKGSHRWSLCASVHTSSGSPPSSFSPSWLGVNGLRAWGALLLLPIGRRELLCGRSCRRVTDGVQTERRETGARMHVYIYLITIEGCTIAACPVTRSALLVSPTHQSLCPMWKITLCLFDTRETAAVLCFRFQ